MTTSVLSLQCRVEAGFNSLVNKGHCETNLALQIFLAAPVVVLRELAYIR